MTIGVKGTMLDQLCSAYLDTQSDEDLLRQVWERLSQGEIEKARVLLDAAELQRGTWFSAQGSENDKKLLSFAVSHALLLIVSDDLDATKFFFKRNGEPAALSICHQIYERLWVGDGCGALSIAHKALKTDVYTDVPIVRTIFERVVEELRLKELQKMHRMFSAIPMDVLERAFDAPATDVAAFLQRPSTHPFEFRDGVIVPAPTVEPHEDLTGQIEQLTRLVVFLERNIVTHVDSRMKSATGPVSSQSQ